MREDAVDSASLMNDTGLNVFVYGTLKPGQSNYQHFCENKHKFMKEGFIKADLYSLSMGYPAIVEGPGKVQGVLLVFKKPEYVYMIDVLEGYSSQNSDNENLYYKKIVDVYDENEVIFARASTYFMTLERVLSLSGARMDQLYWEEPLESYDAEDKVV